MCVCDGLLDLHVLGMMCTSADQDHNMTLHGPKKVFQVLTVFPLSLIYRIISNMH